MMSMDDKMKEQLRRLRDVGGVEIMKASAGSGKTFSLSREYIRLLLSREQGALRPDRYAFRHILAVTFTNKATGEMKSRIIDELDTLANYTSSSDYRDYLMEECGIGSVDELSEYARAALSAILNDYGSFSVCTIDRFFQQVLKAFARDIGHFPDYQIDLDRKSLVEEASDRVLDSLTEAEPVLLDWLAGASSTLVAEGYGSHLKDTVREFAKGYFSETYSQKIRENGFDTADSFSEENLKRLDVECRRLVSDVDGRLKAAASAVVDVLGECGDLLKKSPDIRKKLGSIDYGGQVKFDATLLNAVQDPLYCFRKNASFPSGYEDRMRDAFARLGGLLPGIKARNTALLLRRQAYVFRMADALQKEFDALLREKHILGLEDTNRLLRDIIGNTDTPFVYERLGVKYRHFLLDEFQDTSVIQWENFLPLLKCSIAEGCYNLVVGDVKQSIYRFRNADWKILDSGVQGSLDRCVVNPLDSNWRSAKNIVLFNNGFYQAVSQHMADKLGEDKIREIYAEVEQKAASGMGVDGSVEVTFCDRTLMEGTVVAAVGAAVARGFSPRDVAVLVRTNMDGARYACAIRQAGWEVVTNDSLSIGASPVIRRLAAQLFRLADPEDRVRSFYAGGFDPEAFKGAMTLEDTVERMLGQIRDEYRAQGLDFAGETAYILAFIDLVRDYESRNGNSLDGFLRYWSETGMDKKIASADSGDAVTIITLHQSKGLEYPFVIVPFPARDEFMKTNSSETWEELEPGDTPLNGLAGALYRVQLSESSRNTLFESNYLRERKMAYVDTINMRYVATTRATQAMHIVCASQSMDKASWETASNPSVALRLYVGECRDFAEVRPVAGDGQSDAKGRPVAVRYLMGEESAKWVKVKRGGGKPPRNVVSVPLVYDCSTVSAGSRAKVRISPESRDFFSGDELTGFSKSGRVRGSVLHKVLETVIGPEDLDRSLGAAVDRGELASADAEEVRPLLAKAIASVEARGWFPGDHLRVRNETDIIRADAEGAASSRPDRVVFRDGGVDIIDYKFGRPQKKYETQVGAYAALYRQIGYGDVRAYLWYIHEESEVVEVATE